MHLYKVFEPIAHMLRNNHMDSSACCTLMMAISILICLKYNYNVYLDNLIIYHVAVVEYWALAPFLSNKMRSDRVGKRRLLHQLLHICGYQNLKKNVKIMADLFRIYINLQGYFSLVLLEIISRPKNYLSFWSCQIFFKIFK